MGEFISIKQRRWLTTILLLFFFIPFVGQVVPNLINNYSAEQFSLCPTNGGQANRALFWYQPTYAGSSDFLNTCSTFSNSSVPLNTFGFQVPKTGNSYLGIVTYGGVNILGNSLKEYLGNGLKQTMKVNKTYCITFYLSLSDNSRVATANIGFYFSKDSVKYNTPLPLPPFPLVPSISYESTSIVSDTINWIKTQGTYTAIGNENFVTIGNFRADAATSTLQVKPIDPLPQANYAYYYIDDISVIEINPANASVKDTLYSKCSLDSKILGADSTSDAAYSWQSTVTGLAALSCTNCPNPFCQP